MPKNNNYDELINIKLYEQIDNIGQSTVEYITERGIEYQTHYEYSTYLENSFQNINSICLNNVNKIKSILTAPHYNHEDDTEIKITSDINMIADVWERKIILSLMQLYSTEVGKLVYFSFNRIKLRIDRLIDEYLKLTKEEKNNISNNLKLHLFLIKLKIDLEDR